MGIFPYTCENCGGGYKRCGNTNCEPDCAGGQLWYEDNVIVKLNNEEVIEGVYEGYGRVLSNDKEDDNIYIPIEFKEYIPSWYRNKKKKMKKIQLVTVYCKSCYK